MKKKIKKAYNYIIKMCNDSKVGYSQTYRCRQTVNGITYFDCSSLMYYGLLEAGFTKEQIGAYPFTTYSMKAILEPLGFKVLDAKTSKWKKGDILLRSDHTEMVHHGLYSMGAHTGKVALENQVCINTYKSNKNSWQYILRYNVPLYKKVVFYIKNK